MTWKLKRTKQCAKCPWRKDINPRDIPNGYCELKHRALKSTIAEPGDLSFLGTPETHVMACHEDHESHCLGWLMNQIGDGNNIRLRIRMLTCENRKEIWLTGEQHGTFEETLP